MPDISGMMSCMFVDSHVHFDGWQQAEGLASIVERSKAAGVRHLVAVGGSLGMNHMALQAAAQFPEVISAAVGLDRDRAGDLAMDVRRVAVVVEALRASFTKACVDGVRVCALGEMGLDYHYHPETKDMQKHLFESQLVLARQMRLPVIVHSREAQDDTLSVLRSHWDAWDGDPDKLGVLHCFSGTVDFAAALLDLDFYVSFSGIVTFPKARDVQAVAREVPDDRLLIETDTPYLAPVPHRGEPNEPAYVCHVAEALATLRGVSVEAIAEQTAENAERLFDLPRGN